MVTPSPPAPGTLLSTVRGALPTLTPAERRIGELLLKEPERFARSSISETAELARTSTTTVVRFYTRIGYTRYKDLRHDLTEEALRERLSAGEVPSEASDIARDDALDQVVAKVARDEALSIGDTAELIDISALGKAVAELAGARRIDVFGVGASAIVSMDLQRKLSRIGRIAMDWPDAHAAWTAAAVLEPTDVAVAVSHSGATHDTVEFLRLARERGASTVAITNILTSPLSNEADVVLHTSARETAFRSGALGSRIAQLMVVDCIFIGVVQADYDAAVSAIRHTYDAVRTRGTRR
ncbi:MurR/RpiR family transcriptional regulator [Microbacterium halotolerans]|uniref:MurR/RpiR family transcriptional regulator n=1 Tax=Microbacterium halotolerans TaxID=246613 RepID=UPI000E6ACB82|nr:MurR/RpiR family transcriptional regulator [Microbacterium halotolerans]